MSLDWVTLKLSWKVLLHKLSCPSVCFRPCISSSVLYWIFCNYCRISQDKSSASYDGKLKWVKKKELDVQWREKKKKWTKTWWMIKDSYLFLSLSYLLPAPSFPFFFTTVLSGREVRGKHPRWSGFWLQGS